MSLTDELRRMLDEHGIEWWHDPDVSPDHTEWMTDRMAFTSLGFDGDMLAVKTISKMTPEQTISATVGERTTTRNGKHVRQAENEKLCALVIDMLRTYCNVGMICEGCEYEMSCDGTDCQGDEYSLFLGRAQELGIEVD